MGDRLAGEGGVESFANVVGCFVAIGGVGGLDAIDSAGVDNLSVRTKDKHLGGSFRIILLTNLARGIEKDGGGGSVFILAVRTRLGAGAVTRLAGGGGDDGQPDDSLGGVLFLQLLHVTAGVLFFDKRAVMIEPFEDDEFAAKVR